MDVNKFFNISVVSLENYSVSYSCRERERESEKGNGGVQTPRCATLPSLPECYNHPSLEIDRKRQVQIMPA